MSDDRRPLVLEGVYSAQLRNRRNIDIYLPRAYDRSLRRYPVVYMQDGQNLSDEATAFAGTWLLTRTIGRLQRRGLQAIVVGVPNMQEKRIDEYSPFRDRRGAGGDGDRYLAFLVETLKPLVDRMFRTLPGRSSTGILGSSMGGLISLYALFRHPSVFGLAGALSPSLWFAERAIFAFVSASPAVRGRVYLDIGRSEGTRAVEDLRRMRALLVEKRFRPGRTLRYVEAEGAGHGEAAWAKRLPRALAFLLRGAGAVRQP